MKAKRRSAQEVESPNHNLRDFTLPGLPQSVMGFTGSEPREMKAEVRRNEVWLALGRMDAAVGLDDLMDGLSEFIA